MVTLVKGTVRIGFRDGIGGGAVEAIHQWFSNTHLLISDGTYTYTISITGFKMRKIELSIKLKYI